MGRRLWPVFKNLEHRLGWRSAEFIPLLPKKQTEVCTPCSLPKPDEKYYLTSVRDKQREEEIAHGFTRIHTDFN